MDLITTLMICSMSYNNAITNAIVMDGSNAKPLTVTVADVNGTPITSRNNFKNVADAASFARSQLAQGKHVELGMMQIPSGWLSKLHKNGVELEDLLRQCKNVSVGSDLLNQSEAYCATITDTDIQRQQCALSFYKTGDYQAKDPKSPGMIYAQKILDYAKSHPMDPNQNNPQVDYASYMKARGYALPEPTFSNDNSSIVPATDNKASAAKDIKADIASNQQKADEDSSNDDNSKQTNE